MRIPVLSEANRADLRAAHSGYTIDYLMALSSRKRDKRGKWQVASKRVVDKAHRAVTLQLLRRLNRADETLWVGVAVWSLIDERSPPKCLKKVTVDFVFVRDQASPCPTFLVFCTQPPSQVERALNERKLPWKTVEIAGLDSATAADAILETATRGADSRPFKQGPFQQWAVRQHIREALWVRTASSNGVLARGELDRAAQEQLTAHMEKQHWLVLEEVALQNVLELKEPDLFKVKQFIETSSIDILVILSNHDLPCVPLLAIEFDGPHHDKYPQRVKDCLKSTLLADAGIPLLRISHRYAAPRPWSRGSEGYAETIGQLQPYRRLARWACNLAVGQWRKAKLHYDFWATDETLARHQFNKNYINLDESERLELSGMPEFVDLDLELREDDHFEELATKKAERLSDISELLVHRKLNPARVDRFEVHRDEEGRWLASFDYITPNGVRIIQHLPAVHLDMQGLSEETLAVGMRAHFLDDAVAIVESNEPPTT